MAKKFKLSVTLQAIDRLTAPIKKMGAQVKRLKVPFLKVKAAIGAFSTKFNAAFSKMGLSVLALTGIVAAFILKFTSMGDTLAKTADKLGLGIAELQNFRFAADRAGMAQAGFDTSMRMFQKTMGQAAEGLGVALPWLEKYNYHMLDGEGKMKSTGKMFLEMIDIMAGLTNQNERMTFAMEMFGRSGSDMLVMAKDGSKGIIALGKRLEELNGIISDETARASEVFVDGMTDVKWSLKGLIGAIVGEVLPGLIGMFDKMTELIVDNGKGIRKWMVNGITNLKNMVKGFVTGLAEIGSAFKGLLGPLADAGEGTEKAADKAARFEKIGKRIADILKVIIGLKIATFIGSLATPIILLASALGLLNVALWANPITWIVVGVLAAIAAIIVGITMLVKEWELIWPAIKKGIGWIWSGIKALVSPILTMGSALLKLGAGIVTWIWDGIKMRWSEMTAWISGAWDDMIGFLGCGGAGAGAGGGGRIGGLAAAGAGGGSDFTGSLRIEFENAPAGTRIREQVSSGNADMDVTTGLQIAEL